MSIYREADELGRKRFNDDYGRYYITAGTADYFDKIDMYLTAITNTGRTYAVEIKNYEDEQHPRPYGKYDDYQVDYDKIDNLVLTAKAQGRIPILYARFSDITVTWDLTDIPYRQRQRMRYVNQDGQAYGQKKERKLQTWLYKEEAKIIKQTQK